MLAAAWRHLERRRLRRLERELCATFEPIDDLFTTDDLGGRTELQENTVFGPDRAFTKALAAAEG